MDKKGNIVFAIDCDEVLRPVLGNMIELYNRELGVNVQWDDVKNFDVEISFPLVREKLGKSPMDWFFQEHEEEVFLSKGPFIESGLFKQLRKLGRVVIVTSQHSLSNKIKTLEWLDKYGLEYDDVFFTNDKSLIKCDYLIDDNPDNFKNTCARICTLIDAPYNKDKTDYDIIMSIICRSDTELVRAHNLTDVCECLLKINQGMNHSRFSELCGTVLDTIDDYDNALPHILMEDLLNHFGCTKEKAEFIVNEKMLSNPGTRVVFTNERIHTQDKMAQFIIDRSNKMLLMTHYGMERYYPINTEEQLLQALSELILFCE